MGCKCGKGVKPGFVVTDSSGNCLIEKDGGGCHVFSTAGGANTAAVHQGLSGYSVRPR